MQGGAGWDAEGLVEALVPDPHPLGKFLRGSELQAALARLP